MARLDYANARIGARRALLLGPRTLRELLARPSLEARLELLRSTPLGRDLPASAGPDPLGEAEGALRAALRREAAALLADAEGARARALLAAYLGLDEAIAVKAVLRGVAAGAAIDRTLAAAPPAPGVQDEGLRLAAAAASTGAAVEALAAAGSALAGAARDALAGASGDGLLAVELAVDRAALARAQGACRGGGEDAAVLREHLADRTDARNAATLLALAGTPPVADAWLEGGRRIRELAFRRLAGAEPGEVRAEVARAFPGIGAALGRPWAADRALERVVAAPLRREARRRPLSIAVPLAYLAARREEIRRVSLVLRGAALGLPGDDVLELAEA